MLQLEIVAPYVEKHLHELRLGNKDARSEEHHKLEFSAWFMRQIIADDGSIEAKSLIRLAMGPSYLVTYWQAYEMNGWTYCTKPKDKKGSSQNSSIRTESLDLSGNMQTYY